MSWNPWLTSLLRLYRKACYANKPRGPVSILSVLFFIPFCRFRGNNRFEGERFPTEEVVIVFSLCHINCMKILTTIIYLFHIKTWNFLYKNPRVFYFIFYRNKHRKQASFWLHNITKNNSPIPFLAQTNCRRRNQTTTIQTTTIQTTSVP